MLAWTPGTDGTVTAPAYQLQMPDRPTPAELTAFLDGEKAKVKGRIVLVGKHTLVPVNINPPAKRRTDDEVRAQYDPDNPERRPRPRRTRRSAGAADDARARSTRRSTRSSSPTARRVRVNDAAREHGQIIAFNNRTYDVAKAVPTVVMRNEDYGRISRILADGTPVELEFNIVNKVYPEGRTAYNTIAEIPGHRQEGRDRDARRPSRFVAVGDRRHRQRDRLRDDDGGGADPEGDRRHAAADDSRRAVERRGGRASSARRPTSRSTSASFENQKQPEYAKLVAYLNIDSGTGRARGAGVFGPPAAAAVVRQALAPFHDLGVAGASATTSRAIAGTDSTSFNNVGLPGIGFGQDPIEYNTHTHHTNLDTYERVIEDDVKASAIAIAATLYQLAMRDEMLPRLPAAQMPPLPAPPRF